MKVTIATGERTPRSGSDVVQLLDVEYRGNRMN